MSVQKPSTGVIISPIRRAYRALVTLLAGLMLAAVVAAPAAAHTSGYPYPNPPNCNNGNCVADQWNFFQGQCTSWVAYHLNASNGVAFHNYYKGVQWGNANNWDNAARAVGIRVDNTPARGAVANWESNHVAYVEAVNSDGSISISEMNYNWQSGVASTRTLKPSQSGWPNNFIHIKDLATSTSKPASATVDAPKLVDRVAPWTWWTMYGDGSVGNSYNYTYATPGSLDNSAHWSFGSRTGVYRVQVNVPYNNAWATVKYEILQNGAVINTFSIYQGDKYGWTNGPEIRLKGTIEIRVKDSNASPKEARIGIDAIKLVGVRY